MLKKKIVCAVFFVAPVAAATVAIAAKSVTVSQIDKNFAVESVEIGVGDTIVFVNDDKVAHNILLAKLKYNSGLQKPGQSTELTFDKAGTYRARCGIHPKMKLSIKVE